MAYAMPDVKAKFLHETDRSLDFIIGAETLWKTAPIGSEIRKQLRVAQLAVMYEAVYLRIFATWETTVEQIIVYYLANYRAPGYTAARAAGVKRHRSQKEATATLYNGRQYLLWHSPEKIITQSQTVLVNCPVELVAKSAEADLKDYGAVRHGIAHSSQDAAQKFKQASQRITGIQHPSPGRMLRAEDIADPLNPMKWILRIRNELAELVGRMVV